MSNRLGNRSKHDDHRRNRKRTVVTTIAAALLAWCGPIVDIWTAAGTGNIEAVKKNLLAGYLSMAIHCACANTEARRVKN